MLTCLSHRRSRVQIPLGTLKTGTVRKQEKRRNLKFRDCLRVRLPLVPLIENRCVGWALASPSSCNPLAFGLWRFNSVPTHFERPSGETGRCATLRKSFLRDCEFDSRLGYYYCRCGRCLIGFHMAGKPGSIPGSATYGLACSLGATDFCKVGVLGSIPIRSN